MIDYLRFAFFFIGFLILGSCQKQEQKVPMQSLTLNFQDGDPPSLHPHATPRDNRCACLGKLLFDCLTKINAEGKAELSGAKAIAISPDALTYTFTLRDAVWSDGSPITAFQYEEAWKEAIKPDSFCVRSDVFYMLKNAREIKLGEIPLDEAGVKALDSHTLLVELAFPCTSLLQLLAHPIFAPLHNSQEKEPTQFNGSFIPDQWKRGDNMALKKNSYFWNQEHVELDQIKISFIADQTAALYQYDKGGIDWVGSPFSSLPTEALPVLETQKILRKLVSSRVFWLHLNTQMPPLQSKAIRQALSLALDRNQIYEHILNDKPLFTPLPVSLSLASTAFTEDLAQAQKLFALGLQELGLTKETFPPLQLQYFNLFLTHKSLAQYLQVVWQNAFGIKINLEGIDWSTLRTSLENGTFQIAGSYELPFYPDPLDFLERFDLNAANYSQWTNPLYQEKLSLANSSADLEKRNRWMQEAEDILVSEVPVIPVSNMVQFYIHHPALKGYVFDHGGIVDFSYAYLEK